MPVDLPPTRQRGTTLISLMIGLSISMIVVLATMMLFQRTGRATAEARQDAQADAQRSAALLAASMALQEAGYGINAAQTGTHLVVLRGAKLTGTALTGTPVAVGATDGTAVVWAENTTGTTRCSGLLASNGNERADLRKLGPANCTDASNFGAVVWTSQALSNTPVNTPVTPVTFEWAAASCSSFGIAPITPASTPASGAGAGAGTQHVLLTVSSVNSNGVTLKTSQCLTNISVP